jgi:hypothetical protein
VAHPVARGSVGTDLYGCMGLLLSAYLVPCLKKNARLRILFVDRLSFCVIFGTISCMICCRRKHSLQCHVFVRVATSSEVPSKDEGPSDLWDTHIWTCQNACPAVFKEPKNAANFVSHRGKFRPSRMRKCAFLNSASERYDQKNARTRILLGDRLQSSGGHENSGGGEIFRKREVIFPLSPFV